jgi:hypothetical protein
LAHDSTPRERVRDERPGSVEADGGLEEGEVDPWPARKSGKLLEA